MVSLTAITRLSKSSVNAWQNSRLQRYKVIKIVGTLTPFFNCISNKRISFSHTWSENLTHANHVNFDRKISPFTLADRQMKILDSLLIELRQKAESAEQHVLITVYPF